MMQTGECAKVSHTIPRLSIGMPVFNGERYLADALQSLLDQTYGDFELIISNNASTDNTEEICREYAAHEPRIRYFRNPTNVGASSNFNRLFQLRRGEYFKWAAHDDLCASEFLERCVGILDQDPSVVLCYTRTRTIDAEGALIEDLDPKPDLAAATPQRRFFECVLVPHNQYPVFGVIRADVLAQTRRIGHHFGADRVLLGELALRGPMHEVPEILFFKREHAQQSWRQFRSERAFEAWFDPARVRKRTFPHWRLLYEHFISMTRVPMSLHDRTWCYIYLSWWIREHWKYLLLNLFFSERKRPPAFWEVRPAPSTQQLPITYARNKLAGE